MTGLRGIRWQKLEELRNPKCELCALCNSSVNVCVFGRGSSIAPIVLIGEAPGEAESRTGKPFMGQAGELLDRLLRENDIAHLVYVTNICKCRPPDNRKPTALERETCSSTYLSWELLLLKPKAIVLLGKTPIETFFGRTLWKRGVIYEMSGKLGRGFLTSYQGQGPHPKREPPVVIPTWHPAAYLHSGSKVALEQLKQHLLLAKELSCEFTQTR